jgi:subtilase family serine protease
VLKLYRIAWTRKSSAIKIGIITASVVLSIGLAGLLGGQTPVTFQSRIVQSINDASYVRLLNTTPAETMMANEGSRVAPDLPIERMLLTLKSRPEQKAALAQLLADQQDPSSPFYHQWLTPEEFGQRFGSSQQELETILGWLKEHGFAVNGVANSRREIEFSGTARQVEAAFRTEMHWYELGRQRHLANATDISIPTAFTEVVSGVAGLHDFHARPLMTLTDGSHYLAPYDFATIYNVSSLWNLGFDGRGQSIAIVARSNINLNDVAAFRARFGLPENNPEIIAAGPDPGITDDEGEAYLDVEWAGAIAKGATVKLVVARSVRETAFYVVNNNVAPIMSVSYGICEVDMGRSDALFIFNLWQQAAAQGISIFVSSGDEGSAECDDAHSSSIATGGLAVNGLASTPFNVAVGGTRFNENKSHSLYWLNTNKISNLSSARGYIPEEVWNDFSGLWSTGGGVSVLWPTPSWQVGFGVPATDPGTVDQHHRYLPDVSLAASLYDGYVMRDAVGLNFAGGTSASAPAFAGIMAMINQMTGQANGNPNPLLYAIAAQSPSVFHDITAGSNSVPCVIGSRDCLSNGRTSGYDAAPGYDLTTGWGSVDAYALAHAWASLTRPPSNR